MYLLDVESDVLCSVEQRFSNDRAMGRCCHRHKICLSSDISPQGTGVGHNFVTVVCQMAACDHTYVFPHILINSRVLYRSNFSRHVLQHQRFEMPVYVLPALSDFWIVSTGRVLGPMVNRHSVQIPAYRCRNHMELALMCLSIHQSSA